MSHVLIIEDDATMLRGLKDNFLASGYEVTTADNGRTGLAAAIAQPADLILLDLMLPGVNGYEICREVRQRRIESTIIMLTAKGQEEDIVRGLELGADDYVTKPFSIRELLARAKAFLRRTGHEAVSTKLRFAGFLLDRDAHTLARDGHQIKLTSKEYRVLEMLASSGGRALTRGEILDTVWGKRVIVTPRSVDRCVTTLRGKLGDDPNCPALIQTIRDVGYRFVAD